MREFDTESRRSPTRVRPRPARAWPDPLLFRQHPCREDLLHRGLATAACPYVELNVVLFATAATTFALLLPSLAASRPLSLDEAFTLVRPAQTPLFLLTFVAFSLARVLCELTDCRPPSPDDHVVRARRA